MQETDSPLRDKLLQQFICLKCKLHVPRVGTDEYGSVFQDQVNCGLPEYLLLLPREGRLSLLGPLGVQRPGVIQALSRVYPRQGNQFGGFHKNRRDPAWPRAGGLRLERMVA
jgi:hypothetical protein